MITIRFQNRDESGKRDYLYYLAIGNARIKEYQTALKYVRGLLQVTFNVLTKFLKLC